MKSNLECVICYAHPLPHQWYPEVLLIKKLTPVWQAGMYNLPGGKLEPGETPEQAAKRELWEETGINCHIENVHVVGRIEDVGCTVYVCVCRYDSLCGRNKAESRTAENVFWMPFNDAFRSERLLDNLKVIIPLCRSGVKGWVIRTNPPLSHVIEFTPPPDVGAEAEQSIEFDTQCEFLSI